ncbi:retrotransposon protein, putative, ty1-copia subclass, partial [Tanacetum coccineum]
GKGKGKGKDKTDYIPKPKNPKSSAKEHTAKDDACYHYKVVGHCKRNCPVYLAELVKKKKQVGTASSSVGSIMYAVRCTRPDVAFANTKDMFLVYGGNSEAELRVDCYCNAGFEIDRDDIKSQTGYDFILNGGAVDWKSSKQSTTAMSATKAEYIVASEAAMDAVWIRKFISGFGIVPTINELIKMFCDNSAALLIANEPGFRGAPDTTIKDIIMFANVLNWVKLISLKFAHMTI